MVSNWDKFSLFVFTVIVLCITLCGCQNYDTTSNSELDVEDASVRPKSKIVFSKDKHEALFGGLAGSTLGLYLGYQIGNIDWEADMPAYTVRHYWHKKPFTLTESYIVEAGDIVECPKNVSFCVRNSMPMCLSNGKINCVTSELQTQPCRYYRADACLATTVKVKCNKMWGVDCFLTGYKDVNISIPCMRDIVVSYTGPTTKSNVDFYFPHIYKYKRLPKNDTCTWNNTQLTSSKIDIACIKLNVSESEKTFCSGLNLTNLTLITMNSTLNSTNSKKVSCLGQNMAGSIGDIFEAETKSALARCEFEDSSFGVNMKCGNIANLNNSNVLIPVQTNVAVLRCSMESATILYEACQFDSPEKQTDDSTLRYPIYTVDYCITVAASPMKLYDNRAYLLHLDESLVSQAESRDAANNILTVLGRYLFS